MAGILVPPFKLSGSTTIIPRSTAITTVTGNTGGLTIQGGTAATDHLDLNPNSTTPTTGKVRVGVNAGDYGANSAVVLELLPNGASVGVGGGSGIGGISLGSTLKQTANTVYGLPFIQLFKAFPTYQPSASSVTSISACVIFYDTKTIDNPFNTAATTIAGYSLWSVPVYSATGGGTNVCGENAAVHAGLTVNTGATVTSHFGMDFLDAGGAGSVTNQIALNVQALTKGGTSNVAVKSAIASGTGRYCLQSTGTAQSVHAGLFRFGSSTVPDHGIHLTSSLGITKTSIADAAATVASTDALISYTSLTAARAVNLQAVATSKADKFLFIKDEVGKCGDFNLTVTPNGSEKIDGVATVKLKQDYTAMLLYNNGSNWSTLIPPNQVCLLDRDDSITTVGPSSSTETTVYSYTVLANTLGKHKTIRYVIQGHLGNNTGSNQTMRIRVKFGSTTCYDATHTAPTNANERVFFVNGYISMTGATNTQESTSFSFLGAANTTSGVGAAVQETFCAHYHNMTEDTTADKTLAITCQLGASNANLQCETHTTQVEIF